MRVTEKLRQYWHDIYYAFTSRSCEQLAMTCKQTVQALDADVPTLGFIKKIRIYLHLSLCQACANYFNFSKLLSRQVCIQKFDSPELQNQAKELNRKLLAEYKIKK